mmetsp:Transcript_36269/g.85096  ORF Transcript_36269/g.85096 Transcript_36269/m.85096 type:complete len:301 (-) Transcript_36269:704-1606(-)
MPRAPASASLGAADLEGSAGLGENEGLLPQDDGESSDKGNVRSFAKQTRRWAESRVVQGVLAMAAMAAVILLVASGRRTARSKAADFERQRMQGDLAIAAPNDLWAVHDLLLVGQTGVFMKQDSAGKVEVQEAAYDLAKLLPALHPHAPCRAQLAKVLGSSPGQVAQARPNRDILLKAATTSLQCLPAKFTSADFETFFGEKEMSDSDAAYDARMPIPRKAKALGACMSSKWPRTCSYWVSMHAMAYRADVLGLGQTFLKSLVPVLAGGATMCGGCTSHFRALTDPLLSGPVRNDFGDSY